MDNANPVVHAPRNSAPREAPAASRAAHAWWRDDRLTPGTVAFDDGAEADLDEPEPEDPKAGAESIDGREVFDLIRSINDPEHPLTLEQLAVVNEAHIHVDEGDEATERAPTVLLEFTPTIPHCSMATLIGLSLRVRLLRSLPPRYKVDLRIRPGTHQSENAINKQLNDKERVAAALENKHLLGVVQGCLATASRRGADAAEASAAAITG